MMMLENQFSKRARLAIVLLFSVLSFAIDMERAFGDYSSLVYISILFAGVWIKHRHIYLILASLGSILIFLGMLSLQAPPIISERLIAVFLLWSAAFLLSLEVQRVEALEKIEKGLKQQIRDEAEKYRKGINDHAQTELEAKIAREEARSLKRANERLIARMGHELRTPLNNIIGFSELILSGNIGETNPEKLNEYITDIHDSGNMLLEFVDNMIDLSRLQAAIQRQDDEYHSLVELAPDLICECENEIIKKINSAGISILGIENSDGIIGQPFSNLIHPDFLRDSEHDLREVLAGHGRTIVQFLHSNGRKLDMDISATSTGKHEASHVIIVARDVTSRLQAEAEHKQMEVKIRHSQKMETIGTLAGGIAHDFNNILTPIFGYLHMALDDVGKDSQTYEDLNHVLKAAQRCKNLVEQILTFSRLDEQELKPIKLPIIVHEVLNLLRGSLSPNIQIKYDINPTCPATLADPSQIHQVLMNLCTNSAIAMEPDGGILEVNLDVINVGSEKANKNLLLAPGEHIRLSVKDTGCGMDNAIIQRAFEPFFTTRSGKGTGMGLSVAHGIIINHKGQITVESELGKGTKFEIFLPTAELAIEPESSGDEIAKVGKGRVLFVDDEEEICLMAKQMLERLGYEVTLWLNSRDALEDFQSDPIAYDIAITDFTMPNLDGIQLANEIATIRPGMPVILISGFSEVISEQDMLEAGIRESIMKPMRPRDLSAAIWRVLGQN
ncbi:MAG: response regulator [Rhodospirillaceae bacterium]|nr:response regulator [Rhodospirillaceae bacterium]MBT5033585.1 response regulator [Rhodospirillaceae bacterium]MBT6220067.1 response regulator [Rhodospirillaceae bacterium]MBT7487547.1 response regulator [Rhodospirillales bacterium]